MLLNGHASHDGSDLDCFLVLHRDDCLNHVLDLNGKLTSWTHNETLHAREGELGLRRVAITTSVLCFLVEFINLANAIVEDGHSKTQGFALTSARRDNHVDT